MTNEQIEQPIQAPLLSVKDETVIKVLRQVSFLRDTAFVKVDELLNKIVKDLINARNVNGRNETPLHVAVDAFSLDDVKLLLNVRGIDPNAKNVDGLTPLHVAVQTRTERNLDIVKQLLILPGIQVNAKTIDGSTPLHEAAACGNAEIVTELLTAPGIDANAKENAGETPLHQAARYGNADTVRVLLSVPGIEKNVKDTHGNTPLDIALNNCNEEAAKLFA